MLENLIWRELSNGVWFIINFFYMIFILQFYLDLKFHAGYDNLVYRKYIERISFATWLYFLAASVRAGYIWVLLVAQNAKLAIVNTIDDYGVIMLVAAIIGLCAVLTLMAHQSDRRWGPRVWATAGIFALITPPVTHLFINNQSWDRVYKVLSWWWYTGNWDQVGFLH